MLRVNLVTRANMPDIDVLLKEQDFTLNDLLDPIVERVVYDGRKPVAYGVVKKQAEAIIVVNHSVPKLTRAKAMRELMTVAIFGAKESGCDQLHVFVKDKKLADSLKKHFGFVETKDIVLVRNI